MQYISLDHTDIRALIDLIEDLEPEDRTEQEVITLAKLKIILQLMIEKKERNEREFSASRDYRRDSRQIPE